MRDTEVPIWSGLTHLRTRQRTVNVAVLRAARQNAAHKKETFESQAIDNLGFASHRETQQSQ